MKDGLFLGVVCLSGWLAFATCLPRQYHYQPWIMNWTDAQRFCRESFTDLATAESAEEMNQLIDSVPPALRGSRVWIGLYHEIKWRWSHGYMGMEVYFENNEINGSDPSVFESIELCVYIGKGGGWYDADCHEAIQFICLNGSISDNYYVFVNETMNWSSAQSYCRDNFTELATVTNATETPTISPLWISLFRDPLMYWSDGSGYSFSHWASVDDPDRSPNVKLCGLADLQNSGKWRLHPCENSRPFVCYRNLPVVKKQMIKLRLKSSTDLRDSAVRADILKKLQDKVNADGLSGVNLKWSEQPDGETFHKEEKPPEKEKEL